MTRNVPGESHGWVGIEAAFDPLPLSVRIAREWGRLVAAVRQRGGQPRRRPVDLAIAATADVAGAPL